MKSSIKRLTYLLLMLAMASSCTKDGSGLLDKTESGDLNEERVFTNALYTKQFLTDIYRRIPYSWDDNIYLDACTDDGEARRWQGWANQVHVGAYNPTSMPNKFKRWADYYAAIRACNLFLSKIDNAPLDPEQYMSTEEVRKRMKYEAVCLRALFYGELVRWYGGVPIITTVLDRNSPELYSSRANLDEIQAFIIAECDDAAANLPAKQTGIDYMRVTSGVAKSIKARVMLHLASPLFNGTASGPLSAWSWGDYKAERWQAAADAALDVINHEDNSGRVYNLVVRSEPTNFFTNRASYPGSYNAMGFYSVFITRVNNEYILGYGRKGNTNELDKWQLPGPMQRAGDASYTLPTYNYAACFETKDGYPVYQTDEFGVPLIGADGQFVVNPASGFDPQKPYDNRDSRFYHSIWYNQSVFSGNTFQTWRGDDGSSFGREYLNGYANTGLFLRKFMDPRNISINNSGVQGQTSHSFPVFRLVEFMLNYAEAMNEYLPDGASRTELIAKLDQIRDRADMPKVEETFQKNNLSMTNKQHLRKFIRNERRIELAFEDHRFFDIRRWLIGEQTQKTVYAHDILRKMNGGTFEYAVKVWERRVYQPKHNLLPIPQSEVNNNPNMQQNPGW